MLGSWVLPFMCRGMSNVFTHPKYGYCIVYGGMSTVRRLEC